MVQTIDRAKLKIRRTGRLVYWLAVVAATLVAFPIIDLAFSAAIRQTLAFSHSGWTYRATIESFTTVTVNRTELLWKGSEVPDHLLTDRVTLHTPLGEFSVVDGKWWLDRGTNAWLNPGYHPPRFPEGQPWVRQIVHRLSVENLVDQGFYETSILGIQPNEPWIDRQLKGTPPEWVYAFKQSKDGYRGYWVDPQLLGKLSWE